MTITEALEALNKCKGNAEALRMARAALEKQIKYRWHDLQKDSQDLPHEEEQLLCAWTMDNRVWYDSAFYYATPTPHFSVGGSPFAIIGTDDDSPARVIAWRYIDWSEA